MMAVRVRFGDGSYGYEIMTASGVQHGLYTDAGGPPTCGDYTALEAAAMPAWAAGFSEPVPPPPPVPQEVTQYQARVALLNAGLLAAVNTLMGNPATPQEAVIAWEYATLIQRQSAFIAQLAPSLGLTDTQIDQLFIAAASITNG